MRPRMKNQYKLYDYIIIQTARYDLPTQHTIDQLSFKLNHNHTWTAAARRKKER